MLRLVDRAYAYSLGSRVVSVAAGFVTPELIARKLDPVTQGVYYAFLAALAFQLVLELGVGNLVMVKSSHLGSEIAWNKRRPVDGSDLSSLSLLFRGALKWYAGVGAAVIALGWIAAPWVFAERPIAEWLVPWSAATLTAGLHTMVMPVLATLEGCGHVAEVARMRLVQALVGNGLAWGVLVLGGGLLAVAAMNTGLFLGAAVCLVPWRGLLIDLLRQSRCARTGFRWKTEMLPLQFRSAFVWISLFVSNGVITLLVFRFVGEEEAGRWGMTRRAFESLLLMAGALFVLKAPRIGQHFARGEMRQMFSVWRNYFLASLVVCTLIVFAAIAGFQVLDWLGFAFPARMAGVPVQFLLALFSIATCATWGIETFVRASFREPFVRQSLVRVVVVLALLATLVPPFGTTGAAVALLATTALLVLPWHTLIARRTWREIRPQPEQAAPSKS